MWNTNRSAKDIEAKDIWSHINGTYGPINRSAKDIEAKDIEAKDIEDIWLCKDIWLCIDIRCKLFCVELDVLLNWYDNS